MDGKFGGAEYSVANLPADESLTDSGVANEGREFERTGTNSGALAVGSEGGAAGIVPNTGSDAGKVGCDTAASGRPGTDAPGTRGKENTSLRPAKWGPSAQGSVLPALEGMLGAPIADDGAEARSDPLGGAVGGDEGAAGTAGKEYISAAGGICGEVAHGPPFCASTDDDEVPGSAGGAAVAEEGTSAVVPESDAAIARKSASLNAPVGGGEGCNETPETAGGLGTAGAENISLGKPGTDRGAAGITPGSEDGDVTAVFAGDTVPGSAAKNSLASFAIAAGSGTADIRPETLPRLGALSGLVEDVGESVAMRSLVLVVLIDIDAFQHTDCVFRENGNRAIERNQVRGDRLMVDPHKANGQAGRDFSG